MVSAERGMELRQQGGSGGGFWGSECCRCLECLGEVGEVEGLTSRELVSLSVL
jgi:hypothetical protein